MSITLQPYPQNVTDKNVTDTVSQICRLRGQDIIAFNNIGSVGTTYAPIDNPTFTGVVTAPEINVTGLTASELVATDSSKNLVSVIALPNGTMATTQAIADNSTKAATDAYADRAGIGGTGQLWSSVTRVFGTTYTNATGRPIMVYCTSTTVAGGGVTPIVGGVSLPGYGGVAIGQQILTTFIVPTGLTYSISSTNTLIAWSELR